MASTQSAFANHKPKFYGIMALALAIPIGELAGAPDFIAKGSIFVSLIWGSALVYAARNKWMYVAYAFLTGAGLSLLGLMHTPNFILNFVLDETGKLQEVAFKFDAWKAAVAYVVLFVIALILHKGKLVKYDVGALEEAL